MYEARRSALALASVILFSCASPTPVAPGRIASSTAPPPAVEAPSSAPSAPSPATSSAGIVAAAKPPAPPKPEGITAEDFAVLADVCAVSVWTSPSGPMVGCRSNPPFDKPDARPDGTVRQAADFSDVCFLDHVYRGSFSGVGKDQAVFELEACGEERANDISPGNVLLAEHGPEGWRVVAIERNTNLRTCTVSKRKDRTLLVCSDNVGAYGDGSISWRFTLDFAATEGQRVKVFAKIYASAPTSCMMGTGILGERGVTTIKVSNERFADTDSDGDEDLSFDVERAHTEPSPALGTRAEASCKGAKEGQMVDLARLGGPKRRYSLKFRGEATTMVPTEATQKLLDAWGVESPEFWWSFVKSAAPLGRLRRLRDRQGVTLEGATGMLRECRQPRLCCSGDCSLR